MNAYDSDTCPDAGDIQSNTSEETEVYHECNSNHETEKHLETDVCKDSSMGDVEVTKTTIEELAEKIYISDGLNTEVQEHVTSGKNNVMTTDKVENKASQKGIVTEKLTAAKKPAATRYCDLCKDSNLCIPSDSFCLQCEESYCSECTTIHLSQKATRGHDIGPPVPKEVLFICETCNHLGTMSPALASCKECQELYCISCCDVHKKQKATKTHTVISHIGLPEKIVCEPCDFSGGSKKTAVQLCIECDEVLCYDCFHVHSKQKATRDHTLISSLIYTQNCCRPCENGGTQSIADVYCRACSIQLCKDCANIHRNDVASRDHKILPIPMPNVEQKKVPLSCKDAEETKDKLVADQQYNLQGYEDEMKPGVPRVVGQVQLDSVCLSWEPPKLHSSGCSYQLRFKEDKVDEKWIFYPDPISQTSVTLSNLKSNTKYVFQVRIVSNEKEGPYSESSESVETVQSAAARLMDFMFNVERCDVQIPLKKLPLQENKKARDTNSKTRKLVVGDYKKTNSKEKTILLVGATGSGKSTLVDGMINFIMGVSWSDPYRLTVVDLEEDEIKRDENQAVSQTQWITCYTIHPVGGSRLDYTLNVIDTPGFGDTGGIERDRQIVEQIHSLFSKEGEAGVVFIDAVCFLIKAPDARLTPTQMYIFNAIMSLFGQDIENNFCMLVTFADGKRPPVLSALKEANLPHNQYFPFNNSGLFAENGRESESCFSSLFWEMGCKSFRSFFQKLASMETKSLKQTKEVLQQRELIELNIENLHPILDAGLNKVEELRIEIRILEDFKAQIEANSDFTYTVSETEQRQIDLPKGRHVTNCLTCHLTCHKNCKIPNDEDKKKCKAIGRDGYCTQCSCYWNIHRNTPYIFEYITVVKDKTYTEKLEKYRTAQDENMTRQIVVERMQEELLTFENEILELMENINQSNNILREIALRPDPLSVVEHIDLLIESEKQEKRAGFQKRIASLHQCRKKATISEDVERLTSSITDTRKIVTGCVMINQRKKTKKGKQGIFQKVFSYF